MGAIGSAFAAIFEGAAGGAAAGGAAAGTAAAGTAAAGATAAAGTSIAATVAEGAALAAGATLAGKLLAPDAPELKGPTPMPDPLDVQRAKERSLMEQLGRRGRAASILTNTGTGTSLGG